RHAHDVHEVLIHRVEKPTQCGDEKHDPAIAIESLIPFEPSSFLQLLVPFQIHGGWHGGEITAKKAASPVGRALLPDILRHLSRHPSRHPSNALLKVV